ncbi:MAG: cyclic nucleotide-binding domain-containing protein [Calditrichia bacterium]|nr:cyclic nucleotide-binding domain-containing protein [Calditrichia bacterium]
MIEHLKNIPLFKSLGEDEFTSIHEKLEEVNFTENTLVFESGEIGDCLYVVVEGEVEVYIESGEKSDKIVLSTLGKGDYFGEMSLITGEPRSASVVTLEECVFLRLSKIDFDQLIINNPSITISLSHMLSQRLKTSNIKRAQAESVFQSKIKPTGKLEDFSLIDVLKFCEQNSLTGLLKLNNEDEYAELEFLKGQLQKATFKEFSDDETMDEILNWDKGTFEIEPSILNIDQKEIKESEATGPDSIMTATPSEPIDAIKYFTVNLVSKMIATVGSRIVQETFEKIKKDLVTYFPDVEGFNIKIVKEIDVSYNKKIELNDKDYLALGVFLQLFIEECKQHAIGMSFLNIFALSEPHKDTLDNISFFEYMSHAKEFVHQ